MRFPGPVTWMFALGGLACGRLENGGSVVPSRPAVSPAVASEAPSPAGSAGLAVDSHLRDASAVALDGAPEGAAGVESASAGAPMLARAPRADGDGSAAAAPEDMRLVPAGPFTMGADSGGQEDEHPAHTVTLAEFWLDRTEVTNAQWDECVAAHACQPKSEAVRAAHPDFNGPNQPVSGVSWDDARAYCSWRGKRLPREAEFEKAVRDGDGRRFAWGDEAPTHDRTVFASARTEDVGTHPAGRGPYGHDDLAGNVWEWMEDEYDPYAYRRPTAGVGLPAGCTEIRAALDELRRQHKQGFTGTNPIPVECEHSIRGGAYNYDADGLRSTNRVHHPRRYQIPMLGLRCAKDSSP
ncbi:MAG TPA: SUMF1/EgtB/PvdO family nonheme iron enzyme [Polyangiaceae bacterium]|nr:SUMF1/EgtB/PvdO family nonheme iron enzyme [Polyangiaceae bacterium]